MTELKNVTELVKIILRDDERTRNNDSFLYLRVLEYYACHNGIDLKRATVEWFFENRDGWGFPPPESVRRARQKLQTKYPNLAACDRVQEKRMEKEREYRAYALEEVK
jgi:hypothetical protein